MLLHLTRAWQSLVAVHATACCVPVCLPVGFFARAAIICLGMKAANTNPTDEPVSGKTEPGCTLTFKRSRPGRTSMAVGAPLLHTVRSVINPVVSSMR